MFVVEVTLRSGGAEFESQLEYTPSWLRLSWFSSDRKLIHVLVDSPADNMAASLCRIRYEASYVKGRRYDNVLPARGYRTLWVWNKGGLMIRMGKPKELGEEPDWVLFGLTQIPYKVSRELTRGFADILTPTL
jgi:hypothetical protein